MMKRYLSIVVILLGISLRWYGINWSLPQVFHPDETRLFYAVQEISWDHLNPKFFAYGSLPIYLWKIVHVSIEAIAEFLGMPSHINLFLVGRALSAFFGSLTLIILYLFGKDFFSERVALFSTAFLAFTVFHIQLSHFLTVDVLLTFLIVLAVYCLISLVEGRALLRHYLLSGIVIGLALATKISALPLYGVFLGAHILVLLKLRWEPSFRLMIDRFNRQSTIINHQSKRWRPSLGLWTIFMLALLISGVVFLICEPYALLDFKEFYRQIKEQSEMVRGITQPPYVIQYEKTPLYWYHIKQLLLYTMGLPLGLLTLIGSLFLALETVFKIKDFKAFFDPSYQRILLIVCWGFPVFVIVGGFKVKFLRYMLPLIPFFCLLGALFVERLIQNLPSWKPIISSIVGITIGFSAFYSVAFVSVYHREDPRVQASKWIYEHIEAGSTILTELWEFAPLVSIAGHHPGEYRVQGLDLYRPDSEEKIRQLAQQLSEGDIIILATKRLYGSILRVPKRYPFTTNYYRQLFDKKLGFLPVKTFTSYPSLFGITFNDDFADESFSVYDHPKVILFKKSRDFSTSEIYHLIKTEPLIREPDSLLKRLLAFPALESEYSPAEREEISHAPPPLKEKVTIVPSSEQARFFGKEKEKDSTIPPLSKGGLGGIFKKYHEWLSIIIWLITVELLALMAFPLTTLAFRKLPDGGYAVSKVVGILLPAYLVWILVSLKLITYTRGLILVAVGILTLAALLTFLKYLPFFVEVIRTKWKTFLLYEGVFLFAFGSFLLFRAYNPDIFWSESSMDFSFLNVLTRTDRFPPPDPWISGFPLNYYYFGHYIVATLTKLTGILPQFTYNLAFALFPALVIIEVFSLLYNLTKCYLWGFVGVLFSAIIGNLDGFFLLVDTWSGKESYYRFFRCAHEVIPYTVHEFPFWTFIFVDLHAHLLNMPFLIAVFLVGLHLLSENSNPLLGGGVGNPLMMVRRGILPGLLSVFLYALLVGTLGVISSWDYPTGVIFLLLIALAKTYRNYRQRRIARKKFIFRPLGYIACIIPGSLLLYYPFYTSFSRNRMGLGLVGTATTHLSDFLTVFGFFFFLIFSYLIFQAYRLRITRHHWRILICLLVITGGFHVTGLHVFHTNYAILLFVLLTMFFSSYIFSRNQSVNFHLQKQSPEHTYIWLCLMYACLIVAGCEIVFVRDFLQGGQEYKHLNTVWASYIPDWFLTSFTGQYKRMNTIFKFYIPAWFFLSFVATYALHQLFTVYVKRRYRMRISDPTFFLFSPAFWKRIWPLGFGFLFLFSAVFPVMGIYVRRHRDLYNRVWLAPTIDGLAYIHANNPDEYQAIRWLNDNISGTPVILEAAENIDYRYEYARISSNTGLVTVSGWQSHVEQREHWGLPQQRILDVKEIYTSTDVERAVQLLRQYHLKYIYVGETERRDFAEEGLQKFQEHSEYFEVVFQSGNTVIYRVKR